MNEFAWWYTPETDETTLLKNTLKTAYDSLNKRNQFSAETYEQYRNTISAIEIRFWLLSQGQNIREEYTIVFRQWIRAMIIQQDWREIDNYLGYFDEHDWIVMKVNALKYFRLLHNPEQELPQNTFPLLEHLEKIYQKYPERLTDIALLFMEYQDRLSQLSSYKSKEFFEKIERHKMHQILLKDKNYQNYVSYRNINYIDWIFEEKQDEEDKNKQEIQTLKTEITKLEEENRELKKTLQKENQSHENTLNELLNIEKTKTNNLEKRIKKIMQENEVLKQQCKTLEDELQKRTDTFKEEQQNDEIKTQQLKDCSQYKIGIIFGSQKSVKDFKRDINKNVIYHKYGLSKENFEILNEKFEQQKRFNINSLKNRLYEGLTSNPLDFVVVFELDHETELNTMVNSEEFKNRFYISNQDGQHYSKRTFAEMIESGITYIQNSNS